MPIDDTRVISNMSTGTLGRLIAEALVKEGAIVTLLQGAVNQPRVNKARVIDFCFYDELKTLLYGELKKDYCAVIHAAAVSDYRLKKVSARKLSSHLKQLNLSLIPTEKLIRKIKKINKNIILVGFKLQSHLSQKSTVRHSKELMHSAGCDFVVVNQSRKGKYLGYLIGKDLAQTAPKKSKSAMAIEIVRAIKGCV